MNNTISAIIITHNEADQMERCLRGLSWCDEIVIVDSGSTDETVAIAKKYTNRVFIEDWKGFGAQKQSALSKASGEWIFTIDADEVISSALSEEVLYSIKKERNANGFLIPRKNLYGEKWLRFGGQYPDYVLRLFRKKAGRFTESIVHERVIVEGETKKLKTPIIHYAFKDLTTRIEKLNSYSSLSARQMLLSGKTAGSFSPLIHSASLFIKDYIFRLGFIDGRQGFDIALLKSLGVYFKYAKLLELQYKGGSDGNT
jgi:glycosyltransferase involved in cell wall biosynthesis